MPAFKLLAKLIAYYVGLALIIAIVWWLFPVCHDYLPIGRIQSLVAQADGPLSKAATAARIAHPESFGGSLIWLIGAIAGAVLTSLPVSWVYIQIRSPKNYDQSLIDTIVVLPLIVTSIVVIVQDSLALSFSLAGIAGAARYRNNLKSSGDLLFILLAIGIGLSSGIGAVELAVITSAAFNFCFLVLWSTEYGEREDMERYLSDFEGQHQHAGGIVTATTSTAILTEVAETFPTQPGKI